MRRAVRCVAPCAATPRPATRRRAGTGVPMRKPTTRPVALGHERPPVVERVENVGDDEKTQRRQSARRQPLAQHCAQGCSDVRARAAGHSSMRTPLLRARLSCARSGRLCDARCRTTPRIPHRLRAQPYQRMTFAPSVYPLEAVAGAEEQHASATPDRIGLQLGRGAGEPVRLRTPARPPPPTCRRRARSRRPRHPRGENQSRCRD
jgi:hypothetical protein